MKLEDEIKQSKFSSEYQKFILNIMFSGVWLHAQHAQLLRPFDISVQQLNVLRILRGQNGKAITIGRIQERMFDKMSNASRLVTKLLDKQLISRNSCKEDKRQAEILIAEKGIKLLEQLDKILKNHELSFNHLNETEAKELNRLLDKLRD